MPTIKIRAQSKHLELRRKFASRTLDLLELTFVRLCVTFHNEQEVADIVRYHSSLIDIHATFLLIQSNPEFILNNLTKRHKIIQPLFQRIHSRLPILTYSVSPS